MKIALLIAALYLTGYDKVYDHYCHYPVWLRSGDQVELVVITVVRPVTLRRLADKWLTNNDGADINEDGIVNFKDFAILAAERI